LLGEYSLGLFDDHPAVEGGLQLIVDYLGAVDCSFLQDPDGGHVGQRLGHRHIGVR